ncbi:helix-turn-helix domain-containing protein [Oceanospirillum beijerinckii]|uniref:helix-turn-helix domain-containing protein n=1 Tax=Oceanospirillum beijerinckii TaxID=64976 RepID=UPI00055A354B|nr:helix-turn-helix transcriptional regulator [Oceanospirillum beijerinckii]
MTPPQAARLKDARRKKGLTQKEIARQLNVSTPTYRAWERPGGAEPNTISKLIELCELLEIPIDWLLTGKTGLQINKQQRAAIENLIVAFSETH